MPKTYEPLDYLPEEYKEKFSKTFNADISDYWGDFGFDIVLFDEKFMKTPLGESCAEAVERSYGKEAVQLIDELIDLDLPLVIASSAGKLDARTLERLMVSYLAEGKQ